MSDKVVKDQTKMFIDLGCSNGGSLKFGYEDLMLGKGIGIDINSQKVSQARAKGLNVIKGDCTKLSEILERDFDFALASHFLEHLPNIDVAVEVIHSALNKTKKALFIQQPAFDDMSYFEKLGVKLYFSDWKGHPNMMTSEDWLEIIKNLIKEEKISYATIGYRKPLTNTSDTAFLPITAPPEQQRYDEKLHGDKVWCPLKKTYYEEIRIVLVKDLDDHAYEYHTQKFKTDVNSKIFE